METPIRATHWPDYRKATTYVNKDEPRLTCQTKSRPTNWGYAYILWPSNSTWRNLTKTHWQKCKKTDAKGYLLQLLLLVTAEAENNPTVHPQRTVQLITYSTCTEGWVLCICERLRVICTVGTRPQEPLFKLNTRCGTARVIAHRLPSQKRGRIKTWSNIKNGSLWRREHRGAGTERGFLWQYLWYNYKTKLSQNNN